LVGVGFGPGGIVVLATKSTIPLIVIAAHEEQATVGDVAEMIGEARSNRALLLRPPDGFADALTAACAGVAVEVVAGMPGHVQGPADELRVYVAKASLQLLTTPTKRDVAAAMAWRILRPPAPPPLA
jgi:hypothetical protein